MSSAPRGSASGDERLAEELRRLEPYLVTAEPPDVLAAVRARLAKPRLSRPRWLPRRLTQPRWPSWLGRNRRRSWGIAVAAVAVAVLLAAAPPARAAIGRILRFAGIELSTQPGPTRVPSVPASPSPLPTEPASLAQARARADFPIGVPARLGAPDQVVLLDVAGGRPRVVSLLWTTGSPAPVRLDEFAGSLDPYFFKKMYGDPGIQSATVADQPAMWIPGPHAVSYIDRTGVTHTDAARLAGPTLIWEHGGVAYRLEGVRDMAQAVAVAESIA